MLCGRSLASADDWWVDLESPESLDALSQRLLEDPQPLRLVINATGRLHGVSLSPEKRLQQVCADHLMESFAINAAGPLLLAKAIEPALRRDNLFHFASLSARVGSIGDNRTGGWYAYRGAKAAQNMYLRSLSVEWARRFHSPQSRCCIQEPLIQHSPNPFKILFPRTVCLVLRKQHPSCWMCCSSKHPSRAAVFLLGTVRRSPGEHGF